MSTEVMAALRDLTASTTTALDDLRREIAETTERTDRFEATLNRQSIAGLGGTGDARGGAAERKALGTFIRTGNDSDFKAMSISSDPDGGYLVHPVISERMTKRLFDQTPMRRLARVETIKAGDAWEEPIDADESGATWVGESEARPGTPTPQLGKLRIPVEEIYSLQPVTQRLVDDASIDIGQWIEGKIADKFARSEGTAMVNGDGVKKPTGFLTYPTATSPDLARPWGTLQHIVSGSASAVTADSLRDLVWSLRAPYRQGAAWLMNSNSANAIDKLTDANGDYLWRDGMTAGAPPSLLGYPVEFSEDMPDIAPGSVPIAFSNWRLAYLIVDKAGIRYLRDPFSSKPNLLFYAYRRVGGAVANSDAIKLLKIST
jgi:HK97 family phage major capsid protein